MPVDLSDPPTACPESLDHPRIIRIIRAAKDRIYARRNIGDRHQALLKDVELQLTHEAELAAYEVSAYINVLKRERLHTETVEMMTPHFVHWWDWAKYDLFNKLPFLKRFLSKPRTEMVRQSRTVSFPQAVYICPHFKTDHTSQHVEFMYWEKGGARN